MIDRLHIENLRVFAEEDIELSAFTVLVGPNGAGKSTALMVLDLLGRVLAEGADNVMIDRSHPSVLRTLGSDGDIAVQASGTTREKKCWKLRLEKPKGAESPSSRKPRIGVKWQAPGQEEWKSLHRTVDDDVSPKEVYPVVHSLRLAEDMLWRPSYLEDEEDPVLRPSGANLAAVLAFLNFNRPDDFERVQDALRRVVPGIRRLRFRHVKIEKLEWTERPLWMVPGGTPDQLKREKVTGFELLFDTLVGDGIPAHAMSEGTLRSLALITAILSSNLPALVLLDDLERAIHPRALTELIGQIRGLQRQLDGLQVLATTHSPYLLDEFEPADVRLLWSDERGMSRCQSMVDHPDYPSWCEIMSAGELWSVLGQPWRSAGGEE